MKYNKFISIGIYLIIMFLAAEENGISILVPHWQIILITAIFYIAEILFDKVSEEKAREKTFWIFCILYGVSLIVTL